MERIRVSLIKHSVTCVFTENVEVQGGCDFYWGDEFLLSRTFTHLALEIKHFFEGVGSVMIEIAENDVSDILITFTHTGARIPENIKDSGLRNNFDSVRLFVEVQEGEFLVHTIPDGNQFIVRLPRREPPVAAVNKPKETACVE